MPNSPERNYQVAAVEKALRVLNVFGDAPHRYTLTEIATLARLSPNQSFRLLQTLVSNGFVRQEAETKLYSLGPRLFRLVGALFHGDALVVAAGEVLSEVHARTGETVAIIVPDGDDTVCIDARESAHQLHVAAAIGSRSTFLHAGAVGKILLAAREDDAVARYLDERMPLPPMTRHTPITPDAVWSEIRRTRTQGFAISEEEVAEGMYGIAAPICDRWGTTVAAITLSAPVSRAGQTERALHREVVLAAGRTISGNLGDRDSDRVQS
jgi:DNA-binding IclR family transcriptional regulator